MRRFAASIVLFFVFCTSLFAQRESIVSLDMYEGGRLIGKGQGTVYMNQEEDTYILTAWHCCHSFWEGASAKPIKVVANYGNDSGQCTIEASDPNHDLAVLKCESLEEAIPIKIAEEFSVGDLVKYFGAKEDMEGVVAECSLSGFIWSDTICHRGDSGGPVCNEEGELVGVISGGAISYIKGERLDPKGPAVWPTRSGATESIQQLFQDHPNLSPRKSRAALEYKQAYEQSIKTGKPLLVMVTAAWCHPCQNMKKNTIDPMLKAGGFDEFSFAKVDFDKNPSVATKLMKGSGVPQLVLYRRKEEGWVKPVLKGYKSVSEVRQFIEAGSN